MSEEITINSRIVCKHDTEENWLNVPDFIPNKGETIVYDVDENHEHERMKIGDGVTKVNDLPFYVSEVELEEKITEIKNQIAPLSPFEVGETQPSFACTWFRVNPS
jgi:hypothetical protein